MLDLRLAKKEAQIERVLRISQRTFSRDLLEINEFFELYQVQLPIKALCNHG